MATTNVSKRIKRIFLAVWAMKKEPSESYHWTSEVLTPDNMAYEHIPKDCHQHSHYDDIQFIVGDNAAIFDGDEL
jgi:hypothetical protein